MWFYLFLGVEWIFIMCRSSNSKEGITVHSLICFHALNSLLMRTMRSSILGSTRILSAFQLLLPKSVYVFDQARKTTTYLPGYPVTAWNGPERKSAMKHPVSCPWLFHGDLLNPSTTTHSKGGTNTEQMSTEKTSSSFASSSDLSAYWNRA
ncbi:hypothetical protein GGU11DRAFT_280541 [Lentinula aff. detonsa]|nr:hypothetical protein GGU11DRAFT_280541 [Lentinula aff. detonsa]